MLQKAIKKILGFMIIILLGITLLSPLESQAQEVLNPDLSIEELSEKSGKECLQILEEYGLVLS